MASSLPLHRGPLETAQTLRHFMRNREIARLLMHKTLC